MLVCEGVIGRTCRSVLKAERLRGRVKRDGFNDGITDQRRADDWKALELFEREGLVPRGYIQLALQSEECSWLAELLELEAPKAREVTA